MQFGLEAFEVEWLMGSYWRGMPEGEVQQELEQLGCGPDEADHLAAWIVEAVAEPGPVGPDDSVGRRPPRSARMARS